MCGLRSKEQGEFTTSNCFTLMLFLTTAQEERQSCYQLYINVEKQSRHTYVKRIFSKCCRLFTLKGAVCGAQNTPNRTIKITCNYLNCIKPFCFGYGDAAAASPANELLRLTRAEKSSCTCKEMEKTTGFRPPQLQLS